MQPGTQFGLIVENIGAGEIVVIAFLALVILGPDRIPEMARGAGRLLHNAKKFTSNLSGDMAEVINDPAMQPIRELGEFAARPRQKLTEYALEAEAEERQKASAEQDSAGNSSDPDPPGKLRDEAGEAEAEPEPADAGPAESGSEKVAAEPEGPADAEKSPAADTSGEGPAERP